MKITLIQKTDISEYYLPSKVKGEVLIQDRKRENTSEKSLLKVRGIDGEWYISAIEGSCQLKNMTSNMSDEFHEMDLSEKRLDEIKLSENQVMLLRILDTMEDAFVFVGDENNGSCIFRKFQIKNERDTVITIGRDKENDICYPNPYVASNHAKLLWDGEEWCIQAYGKNGTYVNGYNAQKAKLSAGDVIQIFDLRIIVGYAMLSINNPKNDVRVLPEKLQGYILKNVPLPVKQHDGQNMFYRMPRLKNDIHTFEMKIDSPPQNQVGEETPMLLMIGPSVTMGFTSLISGSYSVMRAIESGSWTSSIPTLVMCIGMLMGSVFWPILTKKYTLKQKKKKEELRQTKYREYLEKCKSIVNREAKKQLSILKETYPGSEECFGRIYSTGKNLWERSLKQDDFLTLRFGKGTVPMNILLHYPEQSFSLETDNLEEAMYNFCTSEKELTNAPICLSLIEHYLLAIVGDHERRVRYVNGLITQIIAYYGYDEVKLVFLMDENDKKDFEYVKWLPHVWNEQKNVRFIATNQEELKELSSYLEKTIGDLNEEEKKEIPLKAPNYIIFALNRDIALRADILKRLYEFDERRNVSVITCVDAFHYVSREIQTIIQLQDDCCTMLERDKTSSSYMSFTDDISHSLDMMELAVRLANIKLDLKEPGEALPKTYQFLQMMGAGNIEQLNILNRWSENDPTLSLQAPVGINTLGDTFYLDLHQKFHGPHGLIAGMTGSGKSEFIITYILSMAVNYHPYEVAFVLIDYKGGGMAKTFEKLPHTVGIITNLDGGAIKRSLASIESELKRREHIFAQISGKMETSNIDIYKYQKLYREGRVKEPLPHLFIISDEFAELKAQQPDFMQQLISTARIGRSLGVHLILATQKPSGVVDGQIWSNSRFRVCLKVQDKADSTEMLKRPDAAALVDTGRFYLQVGFNEIFELGQSAWAGAPYKPQNNGHQIQDDMVVSVINQCGRVTHQIKPASGQNQNAEKQVDCIVKYICALAAEEGIRPLKLWADPLIEKPLLVDLKKEYERFIPHRKGCLNPLIGELDRPSLQRKEGLTVPISEEGNAVIYGATGSGKTAFINALLVELIREHDASELNIYLLDFYTESLRCFEKAPQVGDVVLAYEKEKVRNLFDYLMKEIPKRRTMLAAAGMSFVEYMQTGNGVLPNILVVIHNYTSFRELYEVETEKLDYLSREGAKYGIYFVLTASNMHSVGMRLLHNFKLSYVLQMNDESDYSSILGRTEGLVPSKAEGRGLTNVNGLVEFQIGYVQKNSTLQVLQKLALEISDAWTQERAMPIPVLPDVVDVSFIKSKREKVDLTHMPIGVGTSEMKLLEYDFSKRLMTFVISENKENVSFQQAMFLLLSDQDISVFVLDIGRNYRNFVPKHWNYGCTKEELSKQIDELFDMVLFRNNKWKDEGSPERMEEYDRVFVVFDSLPELISSLDDERKEKLDCILSKSSRELELRYLISAHPKKLMNYMRTQWYSDSFSKNDGIWIGEGYSDQYILKQAGSMKQKDEKEAEYGYLIDGGSVTKMKYVTV